jgi:hypothetical protein
MKSANYIANWTVFLFVLVLFAGPVFATAGFMVPSLLEALFDNPLAFISRPLAVLSLAVPLFLSGVVLVVQTKKFYLGTISAGKNISKAVGLYVAGLVLALFIFPLVGIVFLRDYAPPIIDDNLLLVVNLLLSPLMLVSSVYFWTVVMEIARRYIGVGVVKPSRSASFILAVIYGIVGIINITLVAGAVKLSNQFGIGRVLLLAVGLAFLVKAAYQTQKALKQN